MRFALVGGGRISDALIARIPTLKRDLGPIASSRYRLASRIANTLKAGYAVRTYSELNEENLILLCVPRQQVGSTVEALARAMEWRGRSILLLGEGGSVRLAPLRADGASTASIHELKGLSPRRFIGEGDSKAFRQARRLVGGMGARLERIDKGKLDLYRAAQSFGTSLVAPLIDAAAGCLREAGMGKAAARKVAAGIFEQSVRAYAHSGRRSWNGALARGDEGEVARELRRLEELKPLLAAHYRDASAFALDWFGRHPELRQKLTSRAAAAGAAR